MPEAIQWILRIYCNLYIFVKTTSQTRAFLSPNLFMDCPVESTASLRSWFIDLWNSKIASFLRHVIHFRSSSTSLDFEDPVRFVIRTWPWQDSAEGLPQALLKVKTDSVTTSDRTDTQEEDPLVRSVLYEIKSKGGFFFHSWPCWWVFRKLPWVGKIRKT